MNEEKPRKGFYYTVTEEQVREHQKRSIEEILTWLHETNVFLNQVQTPEEKERMKKFR
jgi:hypothetical protein